MKKINQKIVLLLLIMSILTGPISPVFATLDENFGETTNQDISSALLTETLQTSAKEANTTDIISTISQPDIVSLDITNPILEEIPLSPDDNIVPKLLPVPSSLQETPGLSLDPTAPISKEKSNDKKTNKVIDEINIDGLSALSALQAPSQQSRPNQSPTSIQQNTVRPEVEKSTGALTYNYALDLPTGRNGFTPSLTLKYNSQNLQNDSIIGYGWSFNIPYIQRINKHGVDKLYSGDYNDFTSSDQGDLTQISPGIFGTKNDDGSFNKYILSDDVWTITTKDGTTYKYGSTSASRQDDPNNSTHIFKWMLDTITDPNGNTINYTYFKNQGAVYPNTITYADIYLIDFLRANREDINESHNKGFFVKIDQRVSEIQIKTSEVTRKKYILNYTTGSNGVRSMISSLQLYGYDSNGDTTTQPSIKFNYKKNNGPSYDNFGSLPEDTNITGGWSILIDFNGDGYTDVLTSVVDGQQLIRKAYTNNGDGTWTLIADGFDGNGNPLGYNPPAIFFSTADSSSRFYRAFDINNDNLPDLIGLNGGSCPLSVAENQKVYLNTGSGWSLSSAFKVPVALVYNSRSVAKIADLNGDGFLDFYVSQINDPNCSPYPAKIFLGNGDGAYQDATSQWNIPISAADEKIIFADINGDSIADIIKNGWHYDSTTYTDDNTTFIGDGKGGFTSSNNFTSHYRYPFIPGQPNPGYDWGNRVFDIDSDNQQDLVYATSYITATGAIEYDSKTYLNNGNSLSQANNTWALPQSYSFSNQGNTTHSDISDFNGDTIPDIYKPDTREIFKNNNQSADILSSIVLPTGGISSITYKPSTQYRDANGNLLNPNLSIITQTVNAVTTTESVGNTSSTISYEYANGSYYSADIANRRFAGFGKIIQKNPDDSKQITYFHQGNSTNDAHFEYNDHIAKMGSVYKTEIQNPAGAIMSRSTTKYDVATLSSTNNDRYFVFPIQTIQETYDGQPNHKDTAQMLAFDMTTGNLLSSTNYGEVNAQTPLLFSDVNTDKQTTTYTYATDGLSIQKISTEMVLDNTGNTIQQTRHYYDSLALGLVNKGNETKTESLQSAGIYSTNKYIYNAQGLIISNTNPRNNTTNYSYDSYNLYPVTITNAEAQTTKYQYDYALGQVKQITDVNNFLYQTIFDGLGRPLSQLTPDPTTGAPTITSTIIYTDIPDNFSIKKNNYLDPINTVESYTYLDGLGRTIQTKQEAEIVGTFNTSDVIYNAMGQIAQSTLPYTSFNFLRTVPTTINTLYTTNTYDALGRITSTSNSLGATTNTYTLWSTTTTNPNNQRKIYTYDAWGKLSNVQEFNAGQAYTTFYQYSANQNLIKITDAKGNIRNFSYDNLGNRLSAEDLHAPNDTTFGKYTYAYDLANNLIQTINPNGQLINYTYDSLNRVLNEDLAGQTGVEVTFSYDTASNGISKLSSVINPSATKTYAYNPLGLINQETSTINATPYITSYTYNLLGNQLTVTNPDGSQIKYSYNTAGQLEQVYRKEISDTTFINVVSNFDYNPMGQTVIQSNANGTTTINSYDETKLYRLRNKATKSTSGRTLQDIDYIYDSLGNIIQTVDSPSLSQRSTIYTYDDLNRLLTASTTKADQGKTDFSRSYNYDVIGNILSSTEIMTTTSGSATTMLTYSYAGDAGANYANPHAATSILTTINSGTPVTTNYTYDKNGNLLSDGTKTYTFDYNNHLTKVTTQASQPPPSAPVTATFYPQAGDGSAYYGASNSWSTTHDATAGTAAPYSNSTFSVDSGKYTSTNYRIDRAFLPFNTASLPDNATITSAKLKIYIDSKLNNNNDGKDWITVLQSTQASPTSLTTADYSKAGAINNPIEGIDAIERKDISDITAKQYLTFNLNDTGKSWVSLTGSTKLALREGHDVLNSAFTGSSGQYNKLLIRASEWSGTASDPILEITYTTPSTTPSTDTITYGYDTSGQRVSVENATTTTIYPTKFYNTDGTNKTKHIFDNKQNMLATVQSGAGTGSSSGNIAFDSTSTSISNGYTGTITKTWSHTTSSGSNRLLVLSADIWQDVAGAGTISSASYGGTTLTKANSTRSEGMQSEIWYLANPTSGTNTMSVTVTGATDSIKLSASTFTGVIQSSPLNTSNTNAGESGNPTITTTTSTANNLVIATLSRFSTTTATTNQTSLYNNATGSTLGATSYQLATLAGPYYDTYTGAISQDWSMVIASFKPIATQSGGGLATSIYYNSSDLLGSSSILTDSTGAIVETLDYFSFGGIRIDNKVGTFSEQRKYIGQEYDAETGLNYLNARYYNADIGRFISQDPLFWSINKEYMADPQQWNSYSYARNNPITMSDPSGERAELGIREVAGIGAHGDIIITPENGTDFSQYGKGPHYIIAGEPDYSYKPFGNLKASITSGDFNRSDYIEIIPLIGDYIPKGISVAQYDQALMKSGDNLSKQDLGPYFPSGRPISPWANSGNTWTQAIIDAGGKVPQIKSNYPTPIAFGLNGPHLPLGSGNPMNTPWFPTTVATNTYHATKSAIATITTATKNAAISTSSAVSSAFSLVFDSLKLGF